ncbi:MAG TPA: DUF3108 domain-containing protein [Gallionella sp.]|nr:DUF3108 domain-containing protein [Gallionella sp.]
MIAAFRTPARRIALAIALSALIHAVVLWLPYIQFPHAQVQLPPLSVRLEGLPKPVETISKTPEPAKPESGHPPAESIDGSSAMHQTKAMAAMKRTDQTTPRPLPRHLQLGFVVYQNGSRIGEIIQQLDIHGSRYSLKSLRKTSGLASLSNSDQLVLTSQGRIAETGLLPEIFEQEELSRNGNQRTRARFDWKKQELHYSNGDVSALPADTQDSLSYLYQLSQIPVNGEFISLPVSDGAQLRHYQIEIGTKEDLETPLGKLRTLHLRQMHARGEGYFEIWLGLEYRMLPVKFSLVDGSDNVIEEYAVSDIRAADE